MYSDREKQVAKDSVKSDFSANGKVISLLNFLEVNLAEFPKKNNIKKNTNEEIINQKLLRFINQKDRLFYFTSENLDETGINKNKPDFGVYERLKVYDQNQIRFFDIECKRLYDTTKSKQYVSGRTGGIQRFKENKHGVDLSHSAMIGYVEIEDFNFWQNKINSWIPEKEEHLEVLVIQEVAKYKSTHKKINTPKQSIELLHFWIKIN